MTTLTLDSSVSHSVETTAPKAGRTFSNWLTALHQAIVAAKTRKAQTQIDAYLASLNDETLIDLGLDPASVRHGDPMHRFSL